MSSIVTVMCAEKGNLDNKDKKKMIKITSHVALIYITQITPLSNYIIISLYAYITTSYYLYSLPPCLSNLLLLHPLCLIN